LLLAPQCSLARAAARHQEHSGTGAYTEMSKYLAAADRQEQNAIRR